MNTMLNETALTFKAFEQNTFRMVCEWAKNYTKRASSVPKKSLVDNYSREACPAVR